MQTCPVSRLMSLDNFNDGAPYELLKRCRRDAPVCWEEENVSAKGGHWNVFRKADIDAVMKNPSIFTNTRGPSLEDTPPELLQGDMQSLNLMDPPAHRQNRSIIDYAFKPGEIRKQTGRVSAIARSVIDEIIDADRCEFVSQVAAAFPLRVICDILGVPEAERSYVYDIVNRSVLASDPDFAQSRDEGFDAHRLIIEYGTALAAQHRREPRPSLTSDVLQAEVEGKRLSDHDYGLLFHNLIVGGIETTRNALSFGLYELIRHPDQWTALKADPSLMEGAVEEILRYHAPTVYYRRTALVDTVLGGQQIRAGDTVICWLASANRDENSFSDAESFDITRSQREPVRRHARTFGVGPHFCIGVHLARLELNLMLTEIVTRLGTPQLLAPPKRAVSMFNDGFKEMWVRFGN